MNYNELKEKVHASQQKMGVWKSPKSEEHYLASVVAQVGMAVTCDGRNDFAGVKNQLTYAMLQLFDLAGYLQIDFTRLNAIDYYRAYSRFTFSENAFCFFRGVTKTHIIIERRVLFSLNFIEEWASYHHFDIEAEMFRLIDSYAKDGKVKTGA